MINFIKKNKHFIISYIVCVILGTISHFLFELTNNFFLLKPFVSINESCFEHLKLLYYPMIFVSLFEGYIKNKNFSLTLIRNISSIISCLLLTIFFYTYKYFNNNISIPLIDISSYYIFVLIGYIISLKLEKYSNNLEFNKISFLLMILTIIFFSVFTEYKPNSFF